MRHIGIDRIVQSTFFYSLMTTKAKALSVAYRTDRSTPSAPDGNGEDQGEEVARTAADDQSAVAKSGSAEASSGEATTQKRKKGALPSAGVRRVLCCLSCSQAGLVSARIESYSWWTHGRFFETTDDAYVSADITTVLSKVSGHVEAVGVADNQAVNLATCWFGLMTATTVSPFALPKTGSPRRRRRLRAPTSR